MHFYFHPSVLDQVIAEAFDRDPAHVRLEDTLGAADPLVALLASSLLAELAADGLQQAFVDDLQHLLLCQLLRRHSDVRRSKPPVRHVLAPFRLRRALDFIEAHLSRPVGVSEIAEASGVSRFHFSRAFRQTVGCAPHAYLLKRRIAAAKTLLIHGEDALSEISAQCGFQSASQFSRMFKRSTGTTPSSYRNAR